MKKIVNRFWDWVFHPGIRWYKPPKGKALLYRYPSPGNQIKTHPPKDYKEPYETSQYNIRYQKPTPKQLAFQASAVAADPISWSVEEKLVLLGLLKRQDINNVDAINQAKLAYEKQYKRPAQQRVYRNDLNYYVPNGKDKQSIRNSIQLQFQSNRLSRQKSTATQRKFIDDPTIYPLESLDLYSGPHFQQRRLENQYMLDQIINQRVSKQSIDVLKGQKKFWKALDDSNSPNNIQKVQKTIGDSQPLNYNLKKAKIVLEKNKNNQIVDLHKKQQK